MRRFLTGMNWDAALADHEPELARRLGINLADCSLRGTKRAGFYVRLSQQIKIVNGGKAILKLKTLRKNILDTISGIPD